MMCQYVGEIHRHTSEGSQYDGFSLVEDGVKYAAELGYTALGITDHGRMAGVVKHYFACKKYGINPLIGVEAYIQINFDPSVQNYHATLLAANNTGYANLCRMLSESAEHQCYFRGHPKNSLKAWVPIITFDQFEKYHEGVILLSGCIGSIIPQFIVKGKPDIAETIFHHFHDIFGENFFVEVMPHSVIENGIDIQKVANEQLIAWSKKYKVPAVMTNDSHYVKKEDYSSYLKMWELAGDVPIADYTQRYLQTGVDQATAWKQQMGYSGEEYLANTALVAEKCHVILPFENTRPHIEWDEPGETKLLRLAIEGLEAKGLWDWDGREESYASTRYVKRLMDEYQVVKKTGFADYFLMVHDYLDYAKKRGIKYAARGSVNGFLLAYAVDISQVDSVKRKTDPRRFLHEEKTTVDPDIDMDMDRRRRPEVFDYILKKHEGKAVPISNFTYWTTKSLCNELVKTYKEMGLTDKTKVKETLLAAEYDEAPVGYERLLQDPMFGQFFQEFEKKYPLFLKHFCALHGQLTHYGQHACGIAITPKEIWHYLPIWKAGKDKNDDGYSFQTDYNMDGLSEIRVMKYDLLGLGEFAHMAEVEEATGCSYSDALIEDPEIYAWFAAAKTEAVFQSDTRPAKEMYKKMGVQNFEELRDAIAMNRPGPYQSGQFGKYMDGKAGNADTTLPWFSICEETHGVFVYQEQILAAACDMAGMPMTHVDKLIKGISKKNISQELEREFKEGLQRVSGFTEKEAQTLFDSASLYSFNKAHAVGYAQIAAYGMWMKIHYPYEFYCAALRKKDMSKNGKDRREELEAAAIRDGVLIMPTHINAPANYGIVTKGGHRFVQQGLITIEGVGPGASLDIATHGPYTGPEVSEKDVSHEEYLFAWQKHLKSKGVHGRNCSLKVLEALYKVGAFQMNIRLQIGGVGVYRATLLDKYAWKWKKDQSTSEKGKKEWDTSKKSLKKAI